MLLVCFWYVFGMFLICVWYVFGMFLVFFWYVFGMFGGGVHGGPPLKHVAKLGGFDGRRVFRHQIRWVPFSSNLLQACPPQGVRPKTDRTEHGTEPIEPKPSAPTNQPGSTTRCDTYIDRTEPTKCRRSRVSTEPIEPNISTFRISIEPIADRLEIIRVSDNQVVGLSR